MLKKLKYIKKFSNIENIFMKQKITYRFIFIILFQIIFFYSLNANQLTTIDSRIKTYIYNPNEVFPIILHHGYHTHIDFPKSEYIKNIIVGNPTDWEIEGRGNQIFLQTHSKNAHTNMTVISSKRTYEFDLIARNHSDENDYELAYAIKFYYPENDKVGSGLAKTQDNFYFESEKGFSSSSISSLIRGKINTNYIFYGNSEFAPVIAFNDLRYTYIKFKNGKIPKMRLYDKFNKRLKANIFLYEDYIIIDKILLKIKIFSGSEPVIILNKNLL